MKVISFSLWGDDKLYCQGAIDNIKCAKEYYPDWICRFYVAENCPALPALEKLECQVVRMPSQSAIDRNSSNWHWDINHIGMMWRFFAIDDKNIDVVIFRDCDSRVGARDAQAVQEWLHSGLPMHRMHECKAHWNAQVMGGMWGIYPKSVKGNIKESIEQYLKIYTQIRNEPWIFVDLWWIMDCLWPFFKGVCMSHGYGHSNSFIVDGPIVGGTVNEEWRGQKYEFNSRC